MEYKVAPRRLLQMTADARWYTITSLVAGVRNQHPAVYRRARGMEDDRLEARRKFASDPDELSDRLAWYRGLFLCFCPPRSDFINFRQLACVVVLATGVWLAISCVSGDQTSGRQCAPILPSRLDRLLVVTLVCSRRLFSVRSEQEGTGKEAFMAIAVRSFPKLLWHSSKCIRGAHARIEEEIGPKSTGVSRIECECSLAVIRDAGNSRRLNISEKTLMIGSPCIVV